MLTPTANTNTTHAHVSESRRENGRVCVGPVRATVGRVGTSAAFLAVKPAVVQNPTHRQVFLDSVGLLASRIYIIYMAKHKDNNSSDAAGENAQMTTQNTFRGRENVLVQTKW